MLSNASEFCCGQFRADFLLAHVNIGDNHWRFSGNSLRTHHVIGAVRELRRQFRQTILKAKKWAPLFRPRITILKCIRMGSILRAHANPKKIYCIDHALVTSVGSGILVNAGHLLENLVFVALRRVTSEIAYYKTRTGKEVDFIALYPDHSRRLIQVCESMADPKTHKRELDAVNEAKGEIETSIGLIVTRGKTEKVKVDGGTVRVVPAWRFLLELPREG